MKRIKAAALIAAIALGSPAISTECKVKFIENAYGIGDPPTMKIPGVIAKAGEVRSGATQFTVFKPSGITAICFRGGYCYAPASAIKLLTCRVGFDGKKDEDEYSTIYYFK